LSLGLILFLGVTSAGVVLSLATRRSAPALRAIATVGLICCALAALLVQPGEQLRVGEARLVATPYLRLWLASASLSFLVLHLLGLASAWQRNVPPAMFAGLATMAVALALTDHGSALLAAASGALLALGTTIVLPAPVAELRVAADALRATAASAALAVLGASWAVAGGPRPEPVIVLAAYLLVVAALVQRMGSIPLHLPEVRIVRSAPMSGVPLLVAWLPAAFAVVAVSWHQFAVVPLQPDLGAARQITLLIGAGTLVLAGVAALLQEDLANLVGYSIVQDGALVLLALAQSDPAGATAIRAWLLIFALVKTATAGLVLAIGALEGTRRVPDLVGWARRTPSLAIALAAIVVATYGWPGALPFQVRADLIGLSLPGPAGTLVLLCSLLPAIAFIRALWIGVRGTDRWRVLPPVAVPERPRLPASGFREEYEDRPAIVRERLARVGRVVLREIRWLPIAWGANRAPATALLGLLLALLPLALVVGLADLRGAAAGSPPIAAGR
jgi:NADH:ubiquinone oxidoreductase subunit 2 (subunit N)